MISAVLDSLKTSKSKSEIILLFEESRFPVGSSQNKTFASQANALAIAFQNVELADQLIQDKLLQRDIEQATEAQNALLPKVDPDGFAAGEILPAHNLSGDFFPFPPLT